MLPRRSPVVSATRSAARLVAASTAIIVTGGLTCGVGAAAVHASGVHSDRADKKPASASTASPLVDHGGKVLPSSTTYAIWWGPSGQFPVDAQAALPRLLGSLDGSSYLATIGQYMRGTAIHTTFARSLTDPSAPPTHQPSTGTIVNEVSKVLAANGLSADPQAVYLVYTSNFPKVNYCAWHSSGTIGTTTVQVGYLPNTAGVAGCDPGQQYDQTGYSEGTRSLADSTAHELMEAITDAVPVSGWVDKSGQEVADKCNFVYGGTVPLGKLGWQLQEMWSNHSGGCVQTTG